MVHLTAADFAGLVAADAGSNRLESTISEKAMTENIDRHVSCLRRRYRDCKPIYLIEGLEAFLRKNNTVKNRAYTAAVLSQLPSGGSSALPDSSQARPTKKKKSKTNKAPTAPDYSFIDTELAESLLLHLQLNHSVLIHHTATPSDTAFWIRTFTEHISTIPYRHERMSLNDAGAAFCMDTGQVKTGDDARDTYAKMLQEVQRVTPAMAYGIANRYPNVRALVKAFREEGRLVLEDVRKGANKDGAVTDSRLGPAVSKRLYKVFMGKNEWSTDGIA
jgi:crossover junction endonuclease EME1